MWQMSTTSDSNTSNSEYDRLQADGTNERNPSSDPHIRQTKRCRQFLDRAGDISNRVLQVLALMDKLHLNIPLFLWTISWNVPELTSNNCVRFARTALMLSDELPVILRNWHRPPRSHGQKIRWFESDMTLWVEGWVDAGVL
jgi:hypothetical protein